MPSETDVVNVGLRLIGATTITSLSDGSTNANTADDIYSEIRDDLLRSHPWNFATKRVQLAQSATDPSFEFDHAYVLPSDWLRNISVHDNDAGHGTVLFRTEQVNGQLAIVSSSDAIYLRYVARVTDPNLMAADFRRALSLSIARDLAIPLASSNSMQEQYAVAVSSALARARSADGLGGFPELRPRGSWAASRGGFRKDDFLSD
jgi:hypothetical protein